jgi:hypothetical protein
VNDLRSFAVLQARLYEFLEQQDETTLQAIVKGTARLAVVHADDAWAPAGPVPREDGHIAKLGVRELRAVAKRRGLVGYSRLNRAQLIALLASPGQTDALASEPRTPAPSSPSPADGHSAAEQRATTQEARTPTAAPDVDVAAIASRLRETETEEEGAAYLHAQHLDREGLLAVAAELQLTRVERLSQKELRRRVLKQAIGARRKFAGLRNW